MRMRKGVLVVMVSEGAGHMLVGMVLHRGHSAVCEEGIGGRGWGLTVVRRPIAWTSCPGSLVVAGMLVRGEMVGNARGLLRIVHGIGGESRHSEGIKGEGRRKKERKRLESQRERSGKSSGWSWSS